VEENRKEIGKDIEKRVKEGKKGIFLEKTLVIDFSALTDEERKKLKKTTITTKRGTKQITFSLNGIKTNIYGFLKNFDFEKGIAVVSGLTLGISKVEKKEFFLSHGYSPLSEQITEEKIKEKVNTGLSREQAILAIFNELKKEEKKFGK
jgi:hypothetical protein